MRFFLFFPLIFVACSLRGKAVEPLVEAVPESPIQAPVTEDVRVFLEGASLGPWRLGMSRYQVLESPECRRFRPDRLTGGFECEAWDSPLGKRRVGFVFDEHYRLSKMQFWIHDGATASSDGVVWAESTWLAIEAVSSQHEVSSQSNPEYIGLDKEAFSQRVVAGIGELPFSLHFDIGRNPASRSRRWISMIASPQGQFSFLFVGR